MGNECGFESHSVHMKTKYKLLDVFPIGYSKSTKSLILGVKCNKKYLLKLFATFETGIIDNMEIIHKEFDCSMLYSLYDSLLDYDFELNKTNLKILKRIANETEKRNYQQYLKIFCR